VLETHIILARLLPGLFLDRLNFQFANLIYALNLCNVLLLVWSVPKAVDFRTVKFLHRKIVLITPDELLLSYRLLDLLRGEALAIDRLSSLGIKVLCNKSVNVNASNYY